MCPWAGLAWVAAALVSVAGVAVVIGKATAGDVAGFCREVIYLRGFRGLAKCVVVVPGFGSL